MNPKRISWEIMAGIINVSNFGVLKSNIVNAMAINFKEANKFIDFGVKKGWLRRDGDKIYSTNAGIEFMSRVDFIKSMWGDE
jgi:predicted transcriptional regulator